MNCHPLQRVDKNQTKLQWVFPPEADAPFGANQYVDFISNGGRFAWAEARSEFS